MRCTCSGWCRRRWPPFLLFAAIALALRFSYVIARTTLAVSAGVAIPLVILDLLISLTVWTVVDRIA